jgi:ribonuclease P protein component
VQRAVNALCPQSPQNKIVSHFLKRRSDFLKTYKGSSIKGPYFTLFFLKNRLEHPRFGTTIPKTVGNAVVRNKIKRWSREVYRDFLKQQTTLEIGLDIHCLVRKQKEDDYAKLKHQDFANTLNQAISEGLKKKWVKQ